MTDQALTNTEKAAVFDKADAAGPTKTVEILVDAGVITTKPWWESIGTNSSVVGLVNGVVIVGAAAAAMFGWTVDVEAVVGLILGLIGIVASIGSWYGRLTAVQPISRTQVAPGITLEKSR